MSSRLSKKRNAFGKYIFYFKEIMIILSKEERMFCWYINNIIGILLNFVDLSN